MRLRRRKKMKSRKLQRKMSTGRFRCGDERQDIKISSVLYMHLHIHIPSYGLTRI